MHDSHAPVLKVLMHPMVSDSSVILNLVYSKTHYICSKSHPYYTSKTTVFSMVFTDFVSKLVVSLVKSPMDGNFDTKLPFIFLLSLEVDTCK